MFENLKFSFLEVFWSKSCMKRLRLKFKILVVPFAESDMLIKKIELLSNLKTLKGLDQESRKELFWGEILKILHAVRSI